MGGCLSPRKCRRRGVCVWLSNVCVIYTAECSARVAPTAKRAVLCVVRPYVPQLCCRVVFRYTLRFSLYEEYVTLPCCSTVCWDGSLLSLEKDNALGCCIPSSQPLFFRAETPRHAAVNGRSFLSNVPSRQGSTLHGLSYEQARYVGRLVAVLGLLPPRDWLAPS